MSRPKISVLMPVYNAEKYVGLAIQSILDQTFSKFEFIIIDDHSEDGSWKIIRQYAKQDKRILAMRNRANLKATRTLNRGLKIAKGKYIARMDADDWSYPERLAKQYKFMEKHPEVVVTGGAIEVCDKNLKVLNLRKYPLTDKNARKIIFRYSPLAHPATTWKRGIMKKVGGYNERIPLSQDYDLYFRMGLVGKFANLKDVILKLRTHNAASSIARGKYQERYALYIRIKALMEYGYQMNTFDQIYTFLQIVSVGIIPHKFKFWLFNLMRRII